MDEIYPDNWKFPLPNKLGKNGIPYLPERLVFRCSNSRWHEAVYIVRAGSSAAAEAGQATKKDLKNAGLKLEDQSFFGHGIFSQAKLVWGAGKETWNLLLNCKPV